MSPMWDFAPNFANIVKNIMKTASSKFGLRIGTMADLRALKTSQLETVNRRVVKAAPNGISTFGPVIGDAFAPKHPAVLLGDGDRLDHPRLVGGPMAQATRTP